MKTTVDLEKVLRRQHSLAITDKGLLAIEQFDRLHEASALAILERSGFKGTYEEGQELKNKMESYNVMVAKYPPDKIFHITQIKAIAEKYRLKFLPTKYYKGSVPSELGQVLCDHEVKYGLKISSETSYIMAPSSSFNLEAKPKDPLLFHQLNDDYYLLMHKWGNDLSVFRSLIKYEIFITAIGFALLTYIVTLCLTMNAPATESTGRSITAMVLSGLAAFFVIIFGVDVVRFRYNSPVED
jgi:hypothetical protein